MNYCHGAYALSLWLLLCSVGCNSTGQAGPPGPQGPKGDPGATGSMGPQGPVGMTGLAGGGCYATRGDTYCNKRTGLFLADGGIQGNVGSMILSCNDVFDLPLTGSCDGQDLQNYYLVQSVPEGGAWDATNQGTPAGWQCDWAYAPGHTLQDMPAARGIICCIAHKDAGC